MRNRRAEQPLTDSDELDQLVAAPADEDVLLADSVGSALLVVLDRLSPAQRVAFVLHDLFAVPFETIAGLLDRSPSAAKKLASRARERLHGVPAARPDRAGKHLEIVGAFLAASRGGDIATLLNLLAPDVVRRVEATLVPDGVPTEVRGAAAVAEETRQFAGRAQAGVVVLIDGLPGIAIAPRGRLRTLLRIGIGADHRIHTIDITGNADQLRRAVLTLPMGYQGLQTPPAGKPATGTGKRDGR